MEQSALTVEQLTEPWIGAYLKTRNSMFTAVSAAYIARTMTDSPLRFPVRHYIARDEREVAAFAGFYLRPLHLASGLTVTVALACAIGTNPAYQRQGLGRKVWQCAEQELAGVADGVVIYTGYGSTGFKFYQAMGYETLCLPGQFDVVPDGLTAAGAVTTPLTDAGDFQSQADALFRSCYESYGGYIERDPGNSARWGRTSFFYDPEIVGAVPQLSRVSRPDGTLAAYAVWSGPMTKVGWKKNAVELWEIAGCPDVSTHELAALLAPAASAALAGGGRLTGWYGPAQWLRERLKPLGVQDLPPNLVVLGKWFEGKRPEGGFPGSERWGYFASEYI